MDFQIAGGSVPGTEHTKPGKPGWTNNQDAFHWRRTPNCLVAVVCDGCGSGAHSEVGSQIAARILTEVVSEAAEKYVEFTSRQPGVEVSIDWKRVQTLVLSQIAVLAKAMGESFSQTINDYFLFTMVGAVITPTNTFVFSVGDGVFLRNDAVFQLGPFPGNAPPYLCYKLTGTTLAQSEPHLLDIQVYGPIPTDELQSFMLGTDGLVDLMEAADKPLPHRREPVGGLEQFWLEDVFFENNDGVRRRLAVINKETAEIGDGGIARVVGGLLPDDTTLIVIRRNPNKQKE